MIEIKRDGIQLGNDCFIPGKYVEDGFHVSVVGAVTRVDVTLVSKDGVTFENTYKEFPSDYFYKQP